MTALQRLTTKSALALVDTYWISVAERLGERGYPCVWSRQYDDGSARQHTTCGWLRRGPLVPDVFVRLDDADVWTIAPDYTRVLPPDLHPTRTLTAIRLCGPQARSYRRTQEARWIAPKLCGLLAKADAVMVDVNEAIAAREAYRAWRRNACAALRLERRQLRLAQEEHGDVDALHEADIIATVDASTTLCLHPDQAIDTHLRGQGLTGETRRLLSTISLVSASNVR